MTKIHEVLTNAANVKYFGNCYLQILQKFLLKPKNNLTMITLDYWQSKRQFQQFLFHSLTI
jgi:hypothetical protein